MTKINRLNTLAFFAGYEIVSDVNGQVYLINDGTSVAADSVREAVLRVPMEFRKGLMEQWLIRNDNIVSPLYNKVAEENSKAHNELRGNNKQQDSFFGERTD